MPLADVIETAKKKKSLADVVAEQGGGSPVSVASSLPVWKTSPVGWETVSASPAGKGLGFLFDLLSRGEYASAGAAEALLKGEYKSIPGRIVEGLLGRDKTTYSQLVAERVPQQWPDWLKKAVTFAGGLAGSILLDPMNYVPIGGVIKAGAKLLKLDDAYDAVKASKAGQWLTKHFSTKGEFPNEQLWEAYQQMRNEARYLVAKAVENNVPLEQAVRDIETNLKIPRDVLSELIEKPVFVRTEEIVQKALPLTAEVPLEASKTIAYTVKEGDTLSDIARETGTTVKELQRLNAIKDPNAIRAGETIRVPAQTRVVTEVPQPPKTKTVPQKPLPLTKEVPVGKPQALPEGVQQALGLTTEVPVKAAEEVVSHTVQPGETLSAIAKRYGTSVDAIAKANDIKDVNKIRAGEALTIPVTPKAAVAVEQPPKVVQKVAKDVGLPLVTQADVGQDTPIGTTTKVVSRLDEFPEEVQATLRPVLDQFKKWADETIATEKAAGIAIEPLQSDVLQYLSHYMTPEAKDALRKSGGNWQHLLNVKVQHGSTIPRQIKDLSIQEINKLGKAGKIIPGYYGKVFMDDPVLVKTVRDMMSARSIAAAHFLDEVLKNPEWALKEGAPEGWKALGDAAIKRFGTKVEGYKFAPEVADALTKVVQKTFDPQQIDGLVKAYDTFMSYWRRFTLGTSPQWMLNNAVGNLWNCYLADINPKSYLTAGEVMTGKGAVKGMSAAEVMDLAKRHGVWNASLYGSELERELAQAAAGKSGRSFVDLVTGPIFKGNTLIENHARLSLFIDGLEKGMDPTQAASRVRKYLFDYGDLTDTEKNVFRRVYPFYSWWRKNLPLQLEMLAEKPQKFAAIPKAQRAVEATQPAIQEKETLPAWMQEAGATQVGVTPEGYTRFLTLGNLPALDLPEIVSNPRQLVSMNPLASALMTLFGYDVYRDRYIEPTAMENVLGVAPMPERLSLALGTLFPPLRTAQNIVHPYESPYGTTPSLPERLVGLTGLKLYERYQPADVASYFKGIEGQIQDLEYQYRDALRQGDSKLAESLLKRILALQEQARRMAQ